MRFDPPLQAATLVRRYKRFLADIILLNGEQTTIHCANTGAMTHCIVENSPCWYSASDNPKRKYPYTWEIATSRYGYLAGVNTARANHLVREAIASGVIAELQGYQQLQAEVKYGAENSRIDFLLRADGLQDCYVEVKNITLEMEDGVGMFPDAVSARGSKHLRELITMVEQGYRAVLIFCVQHTGIGRVMPADHIDKVYGQTLRLAADLGVEMLAYRAIINPSEIVLTHRVPIVL